MSENDAVDERLGQLRDATSAVAASPGFVQRVMASVGAAEPFWWQLLGGPARWMLPAAAILAFVAVGWAYQARGSLDESLAVGFGAESYSTLEGAP